MSQNQLSLKKARESKNFSLREAAKELGISHPYLSSVELGHKRLTPSFLTKLAKLYGIKPEELVQESNQDTDVFFDWLKSQIKWWDSRFILPKIPAVSASINNLFVEPAILDSNNLPIDIEKFSKSLLDPDNNRAILLTGELGSGKSFFLRMLTLDPHLALGLSSNTKKIFSLFISLGSFELDRRPLNICISEYYLKNGYTGDKKALESLIQQNLNNGNLLLLFDGLDEISEYQARANMLAKLQHTFEDQLRKSNNRMIISGQDHAFISKDERYNGFINFKLQKWSSDQLFKASNNWLWDNDKDCEIFWRLIQASELNFQIAKSPLMFHLLATLYSANGPKALQEIALLCNALAEVLENSWGRSRKTFSFQGENLTLWDEAPWLRWREFLVFLTDKCIKESDFEETGGNISFTKTDIQDAWEDFLIENGVSRSTLKFKNLDEILQGQYSIGPLILKNDTDNLNSSDLKTEKFTFIHPIFGYFYFAKSILNYPEKLSNFVLENLRDEKWKYGIPLIIQELSRSERRIEKERASKLIELICQADDKLGLEHQHKFIRAGIFTSMRSIAGFNFDLYSNSVLIPFIEELSSSYFESDVKNSFDVIGEFSGSPTFRNYFIDKFADLNLNDPNRWRIACILAKLGVRSDHVVNEITRDTKLIEKTFDTLDINERLSLKRYFWGIRLVGRLFSLEETQSKEMEKLRDIDKISGSAIKFANTVRLNVIKELGTNCYSNFQAWDILSVLFDSVRNLNYFKTIKEIVNQYGKFLVNNFENFYQNYPYTEQANQFFKSIFIFAKIINKDTCLQLIKNYEYYLKTTVLDESRKNDIKVILYLLRTPLDPSLINENKLICEVYNQDQDLLAEKAIKEVLAASKNLQFDYLQLTSQVSLLSQFNESVRAKLNESELLRLISSLIELLNYEYKKDLNEREQLRFYTTPFSSYSVPLYDHLHISIGKLGKFLPLSCSRNQGVKFSANGSSY